MYIETIDRLEAAGVFDRYHARALRLETQLEETRQHIRVMWATICDLSQTVIDNDAAPRAVDMARLTAWATNHLRETGSDMSGDTTTGEYIAEQLWESVGVRDYDDYITRAANGWPNDHGVKL